MVPGGFETFSLQAAFEEMFPFKHVGCQVAEDGQIFRAMVFAAAAGGNTKPGESLQLINNFNNLFYRPNFL
jgi:hypothetical protein